MTTQKEIASFKGEKIHSIQIIGRQWFRRGPGGGYSTAEIVINHETVHKTEPTYDIGAGYIQEANDWLEKQGYMPRRVHNEATGDAQPGWQYWREERGIEYMSRCIEVKKERDL